MCRHKLDLDHLVVSVVFDIKVFDILEHICNRFAHWRNYLLELDFVLDAELTLHQCASICRIDAEWFEGHGVIGRCD